MTAVNFVRAHWRLVAGVCLVVAAFGAGYEAHRPATITLTQATDENESAGLDLTVHQEKGPRVVYRDRTVVHEVLSPAGQVQERTTTRDNSVVQSGPTTTDTQEKVKDDLRISTKTTEKVAEEGRWNVRALAAVDSRGSVTVGGGFDYRLVGPLTVGPWATVPVAGAPGAVTVGLSLGLRL